MSGSAQMYMEYLTQEGYRPSVDGDGDVVFKEEGRTYYIEVDTEDQGYFRVVFPNFWCIESDEERERVLVAANHATMQTKVAKVYLRADGEDTSAAVELFLAHPKDFSAVFQRAMSALKASVRTFREKMA